MAYCDQSTGTDTGEVYLSHKCYEKIKISTGTGRIFEQRCAKNATNFYFVKLEYKTIHIEDYVYYCKHHSKKKLQATTLLYNDLIYEVKLIKKSSEKELEEFLSKKKHSGIRAEFMRMFERPFMKNKSRDEILEIFTSSLDEHFTKQLIES